MKDRSVTRRLIVLASLVIVVAWYLLDARSGRRPAETGALSEAPTPASVSGDGTVVFDLDAIASVQEVLDASNIDRSYAAWAAARGVAWQDRPESESAYEGMSVAELEERAAHGDREAELALYYALAETAPVAALRGFERRALDGELDAMLGLATTYSRVASTLADASRDPVPSGDGRASVASSDLAPGVDLERESLAWLLLFQSYRGYPRSLGAPEDDEARANFGRVCERAIELRARVEARAARAGRAMPPVETAPFGMGRTDGDNAVAAACPPDSRTLRWSAGFPTGPEMPVRKPALRARRVPERRRPAGTLSPVFSYRQDADAPGNE